MNELYFLQEFRSSPEIFGFKVFWSTERDYFFSTPERSNGGNVGRWKNFLGLDLWEDAIFSDW